MASTRRVGAKTSKTRAQLLDNTELLMLEEGYAAVSYRNVAAASGVTAGLVQYYFPTLDELFVALLRDRSERNVERLVHNLDAHPDRPLRVIWEYSRDEVAAALMMEFMALANHRKSIRAEITGVGKRLRKVQTDALADRKRFALGGRELPTSALLFLATGLPKILMLEDSFDLVAGHAETLQLVERTLRHLEVRPRKARTSAVSARSKARPRRTAASAPEPA